jgi:hypothetical protein
MKAILNKIAILATIVAAFAAAVKYQDELEVFGKKVEVETVKVSKEALDAVAVHSDVYKQKAAEAEAAKLAAEADAARAADELAAVKKELEKTKEPVAKKVLAWFSR